MAEIHTRYRNALIGLAAGDAWGYQVEFTSYASMPAYPVAPPPEVWRISDDTQMTLALHDALVQVGPHLDTIDVVTKSITDHFLAWQSDPDNTRAPGMTCLGSLSRLRAGAAWHDADGALERPGCGAVMRLVPAAFCPQEVWLGVTALQAVITHKHPRAIVAALLLADAVRAAPVIRGRFLEHAIGQAMALLSGESPWLHDEYLAKAMAPLGDIAEVLVAGLHDRVVDALLDAWGSKCSLEELTVAEYGDPCIGVGQGWESATATALGLLVADMATAAPGRRAPLDGFGALGWAATSSGDSDSIAAIAGGLIGAAHSDARFWPQAGVCPRFESRYQDALERAAADASSFLAEP